MLVAFIFWVDFQEVELFRPFFLTPFKTCRAVVAKGLMSCAIVVCTLSFQKENSKFFPQVVCFFLALCGAQLFSAYSYMSLL